MPAVLDPESVRAVLSAYVERKAEELGDAFVEAAQRRSSRRSGALANSIEADPPRNEGTAVTVRVSVGEDYGIYQDQGTGIYGPHGERIYPDKAGGVLVFDWPAAGGTVFARSVAGSPGTRFWSDTVEDWSQLVRAAS